VATTLMAGLELGRVVVLDQGEAFGPVHIMPRGHV